MAIQPSAAPEATDLGLLALVVAAGFAAGSVPALRAYRLSLSDGLSVRI